MSACECLQAAYYDLPRLRDRMPVSQTAADDGLNNGKQVLCAVLQFTHQKFLMALRF